MLRVAQNDFLIKTQESNRTEMLMVKKSKTEEIANLYKYKTALDELAIITGSEL